MKLSKFLLILLVSLSFSLSAIAEERLYMSKRLTDIYGKQVVATQNNIAGYTLSDIIVGSSLRAFTVAKAGDPFAFSVSTTATNKYFQAGVAYKYDSLNPTARTFNSGIDWLRHYGDIAGTTVSPQYKRIISSLVFHNITAKDGEPLFIDGTYTTDIYHRQTVNNVVRQYFLGRVAIRFTYQSAILCGSEDSVISSLRNEVDAKETEIHNLTQEVSELEEQSIECANAVSDRDSSISSLQQSVATKEATIEALKSTLASKESTISSLQVNISHLHTSSTDNTVEVNNLKSQVSKLKRKIKKLKAQLK